MDIPRVLPLLLALLLGGCGRGALPEAPPAARATAPTCLRPPTGAVGAARLAELRGQIDCADREIARLVGERLEIARRVGATKRTLNAPVVDTTREAVVIARFTRLAGAEGVDEATARALIRTLILAARAEQE